MVFSSGDAVVMSLDDVRRRIYWTMVATILSYNSSRQSCREVPPDARRRTQEWAGSANCRWCMRANEPKVLNHHRDRDMRTLAGAAIAPAPTAVRDRNQSIIEVAGSIAYAQIPRGVM